MVRRGRVGRGRTVGLSWVDREGTFTAIGGNDAAEAVERRELAAGGVCV